jgi:DNA replication protein DnaC
MQEQWQLTGNQPGWTCGKMTLTALRSMARCSLLVLDNWMRDAISIQDAQDILEVLDHRFDNTATLIATPVPLLEWHRRIPDPTLADAILDRLVHNAHRIELKGETQRKIRAKRTMANT